MEAETFRQKVASPLGRKGPTTNTTLNGGRTALPSLPFSPLYQKGRSTGWVGRLCRFGDRKLGKFSSGDFKHLVRYLPRMCVGGWGWNAQKGF